MQSGKPACQIEKIETRLSACMQHAQGREPQFEIMFVHELVTRTDQTAMDIQNDEMSFYQARLKSMKVETCSGQMRRGPAVACGTQRSGSLEAYSILGPLLLLPPHVHILFSNVIFEDQSSFVDLYT